MDPLIIGIIGLVLLLVFIFLGLNLALSFFLIGFFGLLLLKGEPAWIFSYIMPYTTLDSFSFSVIALFVLMGMVVFECRIGEEIYSSIRQWLGHLSGGIAAATSGACAFIGTMTGSGLATSALMAKVAYPEMVKYKYDKPLSLATCAASSTVAMMIPPSVALVIYAILAGESIGACLLGGLIPGFLSMGIYMLMILIRVKINPKLGPPLPPAPWRERLVGLRYLMPAVIMMITISGGIYFGIFTATEAGGMGSLVAIIMAIALRRLTWDRIKRIILETVKMNVMMALIVMTVLGYYTRFLTTSGVTGAIAEMALSFPSPWITLILIFAVAFLFGMFIGTTLAFITIPLFAPVVADMGFSLVWFVILMIKMTETGGITPPVCLSLFVAQGVAGKDEVSMDKAYRAVWWFVLCDILTLALLVAIPQIVTFLPDTMKGA